MMDPLTWSFVKLFGLQISSDLQEFDGLPSSHAWRWKSAGSWQVRLVTKAQYCGVVTSIEERSDRVELFVDDGTVPVKAVLWGEYVHVQVALGDLIRVEGKLNIDKKRDAAELSRELRIFQMFKVEDPNEELLHWAQVMELDHAYYSATDNTFNVPTKFDRSAQVGLEWEAIAAEAFFSLSVDVNKKQQYLKQRDRDLFDEMLLKTLDVLLHQQKMCRVAEALKFTFSDHLSANGNTEANDKNHKTRALQYAFRKLRQTGLLFLEDGQADRHIFLSFEVVLKPALLNLLRDNPLGRSLPEIADAILCQDQFKCIPLQWIETSIELLLASHLVFQREDSQRYYCK